MPIELLTGSRPPELLLSQKPSEPRPGWSPFGVIVTLRAPLPKVKPTLFAEPEVWQECTPPNRVVWINAVADVIRQEKPPLTVIVTAVAESSAGWAAGVVMVTAPEAVVESFAHPVGAQVFGSVAVQLGHAPPEEVNGNHIR
jgi:hypothetical protein